MATTAPVPSRPWAEPADTDRARRLVLLSGVFLVVQVAGTDYGQPGPGPAVLWFVVGAVLLWFVHRRRSRVARGIAVVSASTGAVVYALAAVDSRHAGVLAIACLGQALPLLAGPVRRHVQTRP